MHWAPTKEHFADSDQTVDPINSMGRYHHHFTLREKMLSCRDKELKALVYEVNISTLSERFLPTHSMNRETNEKVKSNMNSEESKTGVKNKRRKKKGGCKC